jgi:hypothetical protein
VPDTLKVTYGSQPPIGTAYFYYYCASGACPVPRKLFVNVVMDKNNNGLGGGDDINLQNALVEVRKMPGDTFYAS